MPPVVTPEAGRSRVVERSDRLLLTALQLRMIMPRLPSEDAHRYLPHLVVALREWGIDQPRRLAAFLAQLAHESNELRWWEEKASGEQYEGRRDLGNLLPGDGPRYKGRGPIQLTGRANYREAGKALGVPLEEQPTLALLPVHGFRIAGWYWRSRDLNQLADLGPAAFDTITRRINGGLNGKADRDRYYAVARRVFGC